MTTSIDQLLKWRESMIADSMERLPTIATTEERKAFRFGLSVGWRETINTLRLQGVLKY